jgi:hypothetical protein
MMVRIVAAIPVLVGVLQVGFLSASDCCLGRCNAQPFAEQYRNAEAAVLAKWISTVPGNGRDDRGSTTYEIHDVARSAIPVLMKGTRITHRRHVPGKPGDIAFLLGIGKDLENLTWHVPFPFSARRYNYVVRAPAADSAPEERLSYYIGQLEDADEVIARDAYDELSNAPFRDLIPLAEQFPREDLRKWVSDPQTFQPRLSLYGLMLGLCGDEHDAEMMESRIMDEPHEFRLGIDGLMAGYLMQKGTKGLAVLEQAKIVDKEVPFGEMYSAMTAVRFMWKYGNGKIPPERLKESMRLFLNQPEVSDLAISDLARWKDWSIQEQLRNMYGTEEYNVPSIKRAIVRYMITATKDVPADGAEKPGKHATEGARYLEELRKMDPKTVNEAEKYYFLQ